MIHRESQETKDFIADFIAPDFFFSKNDSWHRMGMMGVFSDFVLHCTPGAVAEVGVGESSIYLSRVAKKYGRTIFHCDMAPDKILNPLTAAGYLTEEGEDLRETPGGAPKYFTRGNSHFFSCSSDEFFAAIKEPLAFTFIDGDHNFEQAKKDFVNALMRTVDNGYILLHDTYPPDEEMTHEARCGDVYKLRQWIAGLREVDAITLPRGCCMGVGVTICRKRPAKSPYYQDGSHE